MKDSKAVSAVSRRRLDERIKDSATAWAIGRAEVEEIDTLNILQASLLAMTRAFDGLTVLPELALVDGNRLPNDIVYRPLDRKGRSGCWRDSGGIHYRKGCSGC